jgi:hypothetical protein
MARRRRNRWLIVAGAIGLLVMLGALALALFNPRLTRYVESESFRIELEKQTAKGLHFTSGKYGPIHRTGLLTASSDHFRAENGRKAITSMNARGITATFNHGVCSCGGGNCTLSKSIQVK